MTLTVIQGQPVEYDPARNIIHFTADADIDCDGSGGNPWGDPYFQPDTSLHVDGHALNAEKVPFIVVPPAIIAAVKPVVLGSWARVTYYRTGRQCLAVVGDIGPRSKIGEISVECARRLGMNPSPIDGGEDDFTQVLYEIEPGRPAVIDGITYPLQPWRRPAPPQVIRVEGERPHQPLTEF